MEDRSVSEQRDTVKHKAGRVVYRDEIGVEAKLQEEIDNLKAEVWDLQSQLADAHALIKVMKCTRCGSTQQLSLF